MCYNGLIKRNQMESLSYFEKTTEDRALVKYLLFIKDMKIEYSESDLFLYENAYRYGVMDGVNILGKEMGNKNEQG